jgi:hypothetical protein
MQTLAEMGDAHWGVRSENQSEFKKYCGEFNDVWIVS